MYYLYLTLGGLGVVCGAILAMRGAIEARYRWMGGLLAFVSVLFVLNTMFWSSRGLAQRHLSALERRNHALGFGIGNYLKQNHPGRHVVVLRVNRGAGHEQFVVDGLMDGLAGANNVLERFVDVSPMQTRVEIASLLTPEFLREIKTVESAIVVSFAGMPVRLDAGKAFDEQASLELWRSPAYRSLQWVLPYPPDTLAPEFYTKARVLAFVQDKPQTVKPGEMYPDYLYIKGKPAELFNAWFELVTKDASE